MIFLSFHLGVICFNAWGVNSSHLTNVGELEGYGRFTGVVLPTFVGEDGPFSPRTWWVDRTCKSLLIKDCIQKM